VNFLENKLVEKWRKLIFETENQLKDFENTSVFTYNDKCVYETWEQFLDNQKGSLENYINFLNHKNLLNHEEKEEL
jgi:hypothetical protein